VSPVAPANPEAARTGEPGRGAKGSPGRFPSRAMARPPSSAEIRKALAFRRRTGAGNLAPADPRRGLPASGHEESAGVLPSVALTLPGSNVLPSELAPTTTALLVRTHVSYDGIPRTLTEGWYCRSPVVERHRDRVNGA